MKTTTLFAAALSGMLLFLSVPSETKGQSVNVNFSVFYNELGRYGTWVNSPRYGQVWIYREPGFRPYYSRGRWEYTNEGWAWFSDYEWGWAPFHYGRWEYDDYYGGWIWIPDYEWAPAWVSWSESGDYYGWAPLGFGVSINIGFGSIPYDRWTFCSRPYFNSSRFYDHCVPFSSNRTVIRNYTVINNVYGNGRGRYYGGPDRYQAQRYSRVDIRPRHIERDNRFNGRNDRDNRFDNRRGDNRNDVGRNDRFPDRRYDNAPGGQVYGNRSNGMERRERPDRNQPRQGNVGQENARRDQGVDPNRQRGGGWDRANNDSRNNPPARQRGFERRNEDGNGNGNRGWGNRGTERGNHDNGRRGRG